MPPRAQTPGAWHKSENDPCTKTIAASSEGERGGIAALSNGQLTPSNAAKKFRVVSLAEHGKGGGARLCFTRLPYDAESFA